jgi:hypothetical protein
MTMTSKPTLVGFVGRKWSGKDTGASGLVEVGYANVKFAGGLKVMLAALLEYQGVDRVTVERMLEGDLKETPTPYLGGRTPRHAMQTLGTEWGRELIADDIWVQIGLNKAKTGKSVITDVRFPNEAAAIKEAGGVVIGIEADWINPVEGEHESEAKIDEIISGLPLSHRVRNTKVSGLSDEANIAAFRERVSAVLISL